jgi:hypothetical protein
MRWVLLVLIGGIMAEGLLRLDPVLPSLSAGFQAFSPVDRPGVTPTEPDQLGCVEADPHGMAPTAWAWMVGRDLDAEPIKLLVAGDSVTLGAGVRPGKTWAVAIGERLSAARSRPVEIINAGVNAAGYCGVMRAVHHHLANEHFDKVVIAFFADDLEQRAVVLADGKLRADPSQIPGPVGAVLGHSFLANWIWFQALVLAVEPGSMWAPKSAVDRPGRTIPPDTRANLAAGLEGLKPVVDLWLLNPPAGMSLCADNPKPGTDCDWLSADMDIIAGALEAAGLRWIDNRRLFDGADHQSMLGVERAWFKRDGRLPVHPSSVGHAAIADAVPQDWFAL